MDLVEYIRSTSRPLEALPTGREPRLEVLPEIRSVIFDVYGTLFISGSGDIGVSSTSSKPELLAGALAACGLPARDPEATLAAFFATIRRHHDRARASGVDVPEVCIEAVWKESLGYPGDAADLRELALRYECATNPVWPMPGMQEMLARLHRTFRLGIVSNAQFFTPLLFEALAGGRVEALGFDPSCCAWSYALGAAKPSPRLFEALENCEPAESLYVGNDLLNDIYTASQAGFRTAWFAGDARSLRAREDDPRCRDLEADVVLTDLKQLETVLCIE